MRPTQKQSGGSQIVELVINNGGPEWISGNGVNISIVAPGIQTVEPGFIKRLRPGDQKRINVSVMGSGNVTVEIQFTGSLNATYSAGVVKFGLQEYTSELASLSNHESPEWFNGAKYGIFIRRYSRILRIDPLSLSAVFVEISLIAQEIDWGPYCVPGWVRIHFLLG